MPSDHEYDDDEEEAEGPRSSFGTYLAEGDTLFKQSEYKKALESYSLALELQPNDKTCLVARSKCYLKLGDPQKALLDAEAALEEDKEFNKGLYRKAEALYSMGDFEYALMYYHRGHKLRPELNEFRLGIQKAQEAIDNSIGSAAKIKLENKGDLSFFTKQDELGMKKRTTGGGMAGYLKPTPVLKIKPAANRNKEVKPPTASKKTVKQLLGELYADKEYLEHLMSEDDFIKNNPDGPIFDLVKGGLNYLDTRTEFWRQQKPLYARKTNETKGFHVKKGRKTKKSVAKYILQQLEAVDQALTQGNPERCMRLAEPLLKAVDNIKEKELPNKTEIVANLNSCIGSAFLDMSQLPKALTHHKRDLALSKASNHEDGISRSLDNIGRVYAKMGKYDLAISCWMDKITLIASALEGAWLYHEIGRCHLEKASYGDALLFGGKSLMAARECEDEMWQLNAHVLIAQTHAQGGNTHESVEAFEQALLVSQSLGDESAEAAITKAMLDVVSKDPHYKKLQAEKEEADNEESAAEQRPEYLSEDTEVSKRSPSPQSRSPSTQSRSASELSNRSRKSNRSRSPQSDGNRSHEHQSEMSDRNDTAQSNRDTDTAATSNDESSLRQDEQTPSGRSATPQQSSVKEPSENEEEDEKGQRRLGREANNEKKEDDKIAGEEERKESLGENSDKFEVQDSTSMGGVLSDSDDSYGTKDEAEKPELATDVSEDQSEAEFPPTDPQTQHSKADEDKEKDNTPIETSKNETGDLPNEINEKKETSETTDNNLQGEANETTGNNLQNEANETTDSNLQNDVNGSTEKNGLSGAENKANETTPDNNLQNEANEKTDNLPSEANETSDSNLPNEANESRDIRSQTEAKIPTLPREMQIITPDNVSDDPNTTGEQPVRKAGDDFAKEGTSGSLKKTAVEETDNREAAGSSNEDRGDNKPIDESARSDSNSTKTDKPDDESLLREMGKSVPIREIIL